MADTEAISGIGVVIQRGDGESDENFTTIAEIQSIDGPNKTRPMIKATKLDSDGGYDEFIPGFKDGGTISLVMMWTRDGYDAMNDDYESDDSVNYQIIATDTGATTYSFTAYCSDLGFGVPDADKILAPCSLKITGQPTMSS